jgi:hypothetical protein
VNIVEKIFDTEKANYYLATAYKHLGNIYLEKKDLEQAERLSHKA